MREQRRLAQDRPQQQMLHATSHDRVEDRVLAVGDGVDFHHVAFTAFAVILRELAEWPFQLARTGQQTSLDYDLGIGRHPQIAGEALDHGQGPPMQRTGNRQLVDIDRSNRLRGEQRQRIDADDNRRFERPSVLRGGYG